MAGCNNFCGFLNVRATRTFRLLIDVLRDAIDELGHTQNELADLLGSRSRASEILARRRALTVDMIHKIGEAWKIPADLLVRPYKVESTA